MRDFKRFLAMGDIHAGHRVGLTPTEFQTQLKGLKYYNITRELWDWYANEVEKVKPVDICLINGDAIDGKGYRSGSTEQITADWAEQRAIAAAGIRVVGADKYAFTYGTGYHVGDDYDHENELAKEFDAEIHSQDWLDINGTVFDCKHHVGGSSTPYGKGTPIAKERLWNFLWSEHEEQPKADVILRSHVHYHTHIGEPGWLAMILPALQGQGSKYGGRRCSGMVHFGFVVFDCYEGGYTWTPHILRAVSQKRTARKL